MLVVLVNEGFVFELIPVNGSASCAIVVGEVSSLRHEPLYHPVKLGPQVPLALWLLA